jgi:hypothetical protein
VHEHLPCLLGVPISQRSLEAAGESLKSRTTERGRKMIIVTTIYCAELEPVHEPCTQKVVEKCVADLKNASRDLLSVYQGTNRMLPMDGER